MRFFVLDSFRNYLLTKIGKTLARCVRIETINGGVFGFTSHSRNLVIDNIVYHSILGIQVSDIRYSEGLVPDTFTISTVLTDTLEELVVAGIFDDARVEVFVVNYMDLTLKKIIEKTGRIGDITRQDGFLQFEVRGLAQILDTRIGRKYSVLCDVEDLGDERCTVNLFPVVFRIRCNVVGAPINTITRIDGGSFINDGYMVGHGINITGSSTSNNISTAITALSDSVMNVSGGLVNESGVSLTITQETQFYKTGSIVLPSTSRRTLYTNVTFPNFWANHGWVRFLSGENMGLRRDIRVQTSDGTLTTYLTFPFQFQVGDQIEVVAGCDRTFETCKTKFNNVKNFRGFPHVPTTEDVFHQPQVN